MPKRDMLLLKCDKIITKVYNCTRFFYGASKEARTAFKRNENLNENNDTCFILACGPSIRHVDLDFVYKHTTFTVNCFHQGAEGYESNYHLFFDPLFQQEGESYVVDFHKKYPNTKIIMKYDRKVTKKINPEYYYIDGCLVDDGKIHYNMTKKMTGSINVVPVAIECAIYMGFKKIYLLGCDFSMYTRIKNQHFYDTSLNEHNTIDVRNNIELNNVGNLIRCAFVHKQHYEINELANSLGVKILNATDESLIDAYDSIAYNKLIEDL